MMPDVYVLALIYNSHRKSADSLQEVPLISAFADLLSHFTLVLHRGRDRTSHPLPGIATSWRLSHHPNMHGVKGRRETGRSGESKLRLTYLRG